MQPTGADLGCRPQPSLGRCRVAKQLEDRNAAERPAAEIVLRQKVQTQLRRCHAAEWPATVALQLGLLPQVTR